MYGNDVLYTSNVVICIPQSKNYVISYNIVNVMSQDVLCLCPTAESNLINKSASEAIVHTTAGTCCGDQPADELLDNYRLQY